MGITKIINPGGCTPTAVVDQVVITVDKLSVVYFKFLCATSGRCEISIRNTVNATIGYPITFDAEAGKYYTQTVIIGAGFKVKIDYGGATGNGQLWIQNM